MSAVDALVLAAYFAAVLAIGLRFRGRQETTEDYFLAGRSLPGWVVAFSLIGTMIGSTTFIGHPAEVVRTNMWNLPWFLALPVVMLFVSRRVVPLYRGRLRMTVYEYLEQRFGYFARAYGALAFVGSRIVDVGATLFFLGVAVAALTGLPLEGVIAGVGALTVAYTLVGGFAAVAWAEVLQSLLLLVGAAIVLGTALFGADGGPGAVLGAAWEGGRFGLGDWSPALSTPDGGRTAWMLVLGGVFWALQRYAVDQHLVQRYLVARTDREAQRASYVGAVACVPIWLTFLFLGAAIYGYYQVEGNLPAREVLDTPSSIVPHFVLHECPRGALGLVVAALAAAAMSSLAADLNSLATVAVEDFAARLRPGSSERARLRVGRVAVLVTGAASIGCSLVWSRVESAIELMVLLLLVATAGLLGLFALGLLSRRATPAGAACGMVAAVAFTAWGTATAVELPIGATARPLLDLGRWNFPLDPMLIGVGAHLVLFAVGYAASRVLGRPKADAARLTLAGR